MIYFSGFLLERETELFSTYIDDRPKSVYGFSYGAQLALEYAYCNIEKVDKLILISPAFFQFEKESFTRSQLRYFKSNKDQYIKQFLLNAAYPSSVNLLQYLKKDVDNSLEKLLTYTWKEDKLEYLISNNIEIEVYLGEDDAIMNAEDAFSFFSPLCKVELLPKLGHILKGNR